MWDGYIQFEKLSEKKLKRLIGIILEIAGVNVEAVDQCLRRGEEIQEVWSQMDELLRLVTAIREELEPEILIGEENLDVIFAPPSPDQMPETQLQQESWHGDDYNNGDDIDIKEGIVLVGVDGNRDDTRDDVSSDHKFHALAQIKPARAKAAWKTRGSNCVVKGCMNRQQKRSGDPRNRDKDVTMHCFPLHNPILLNQWLEAIGREDFKPARGSKLCSEHFQEKDFSYNQRRRRLKKNAVPSIIDIPTQFQTKTSKISPKKQLLLSTIT